MKKALSVKEAMQICGLGRTKLYQEISAGRLRAKKLGSRTLILVADLDNWLNALPNFDRPDQATRP